MEKGYCGTHMWNSQHHHILKPPSIRYRSTFLKETRDNSFRILKILYQHFSFHISQNVPLLLCNPTIYHLSHFPLSYHLLNMPHSHPFFISEFVCDCFTLWSFPYTKGFTQFFSTIKKYVLNPDSLRPKFLFLWDDKVA